MTKKITDKSRRRSYSKPQVTRVKLDIATGVLGECWTSVFQFPSELSCQTALCSA
jgi:hypothetical protein